MSTHEGMSKQTMVDPAGDLFDRENWHWVKADPDCEGDVVTWPDDERYCLECGCSNWNELDGIRHLGSNFGGKREPHKDEL